MKNFVFYFLIALFTLLLTIDFGSGIQTNQTHYCTTDSDCEQYWNY